MNSNDDLVSIIIPVYNSARFLSESIKSVLNQTYKKIEIIVINDGSTDNSLEVLQQFSNQIKIISQPNQGLATALCTGIKNVNGRWFKWFSPDDVLYQNSIETCVCIAKTLPENTIIYSNWEMIDTNGNKIRNFFESNYNDLQNFEFNIRLLDGQQINVNTALIPISLIEKGCTFNQLQNAVAVDYDFFLRAGILYKTKFYLISQSLLKYRIHKSQLSHQDIVKSLLSLPYVRSNILAHLQPLEKNNYENALKEYNKKKSMPKKIMDLGLKLIINILPNDLANYFLLIYLNKIRRRR